MTTSTTILATADNHYDNGNGDESMDKIHKDYPLSDGDGDAKTTTTTTIMMRLITDIDEYMINHDGPNDIELLLIL